MKNKKNKMRILIYFIIFTNIFILVSCSGKIEKRKVLPQNKFVNKIESDRVFQYNWWESFKSKELNRLINEALSKNFNIKKALLKIKELELQYKRDKISLLPQINLLSGYSHSKSKKKDFPTLNIDSYTLGLNTSYEIDLWKKIREGIKITELTKLEQVAAFDTAMVTLTSEITKNWLTILTIRKKQEILNKQILFTKNKLNILKINYSTNIARLNDYLSTRQLLFNLKNELTALKAEEKIFLNNIKLLLGRSSEENLEINGKTFYQLPIIYNIGFPANLLNNRPDIKIAQLKLSKAYSNKKIAYANRLPDFTFSSNFDFNSDKISTIFDNWLLKLAFSFVYPLVDYNKRKIDEKIKEIQQEEEFLNYKYTVYNAIKEVEDAFINLKKSKIILDTSFNQVENEKKQLENLENNYLVGEINLLSILSTKISLLNYEKSYEIAKLNYLLNLVNLYKSVGGKYYGE